MRSYSPFLLALVLVFNAGIAQAQWKWRDKAGQVHISDLPPPSDVADKDVMQRPAVAQRPAMPVPAASTPPVPAEAKPRVDPELEARRKKVEDEKAKQRQQEETKQAALQAENCKRAREQLQQLDSGMRIARMNDKGEREILDDKARSAEAQRARDIAATDCR